MSEGSEFRIRYFFCLLVFRNTHWSFFQWRVLCAFFFFFEKEKKKAIRTGGFVAQSKRIKANLRPSHFFCKHASPTVKHYLSSHNRKFKNTLIHCKLLPASRRILRDFNCHLREFSILFARSVNDLCEANCCKIPEIRKSLENAVKPLITLLYRLPSGAWRASGHHGFLHGAWFQTVL